MLTQSNVLFRKLQDFEIEDMKKHARENYVPGSPVNQLFHPAYRMECELMNFEVVQAK